MSLTASAGTYRAVVREFAKVLDCELKHFGAQKGVRGW